MPNKTSELPEWEQVLSSAAHLQRILPDAVLVGGTAAAIYAGHRIQRMPIMCSPISGSVSMRCCPTWNP